MRRLYLTLLAACTLPLSGCCTVARLFCGPDTSEWVSVDYTSPELAVRTFLEALRRDNATVIYEALSQNYRQDLGIDEGMSRLAWPKIREQNPGLHLAGYAEVPEATMAPGNLNLATMELDVEGTKILLRLRRECQWSIRFRRPGNVPASIKHGYTGMPVADIATVLTVQPVADDAEESNVIIKPLYLPHPRIDEIPASHIDFAGVEQTWRIDGLTMLQE